MASRRGTGGVADEARSKRTAQQPVRPLRFLENPGDNGGPVTNLQRAACCECTSGRGTRRTSRPTEQALAPGQARLREDWRRSETRQANREAACARESDGRIVAGGGEPSGPVKVGERQGSRTQPGKGGRS